MQFTLDHSTDVAVLKAQGEVVVLEKKVAVLENENKMLIKITDLKADVIDIKDLVNKVVDKLPTVNINGGVAMQSDGKS